MSFEIKINEKLSLKLRNEEDTESVFNLVDKNREHLRPWFPWVDTSLTPEDSKKFILECREGFKEGRSADFGVWYEGRLIGSMGFHTIKKDNSWAEIGYWLDKSYEGNGIMSECVRAMIRYGFDDLGLHRIQIRCDSRNQKSKAIPERLGFQLEGVVREDHKHEDGTFSDGLIYGLLQNEYKDN